MWPGEEDFNYMDSGEWERDIYPQLEEIQKFLVAKGIPFFHAQVISRVGDEIGMSTQSIQRRPDGWTPEMFKLFIALMENPVMVAVIMGAWKSLWDSAVATGVEMENPEDRTYFDEEIHTHTIEGTGTLNDIMNRLKDILRKELGVDDDGEVVGGLDGLHDPRKGYDEISDDIDRWLEDE